MYSQLNKMVENLILRIADQEKRQSTMLLMHREQSVTSNTRVTDTRLTEAAQNEHAIRKEGKSSVVLPSLPLSPNSEVKR